MWRIKIRLGGTLVGGNTYANQETEFTIINKLSIDSTIRFILLGFCHQGFRLNVDDLVQAIKYDLINNNTIGTQRFIQIIRDSSTGVAIEVYVKRSVH